MMTSMSPEPTDEHRASVDPPSPAVAQYGMKALSVYSSSSSRCSTPQPESGNAAVEEKDILEEDRLDADGLSSATAEAFGPNAGADAL